MFVLTAHVSDPMVHDSSTIPETGSSVVETSTESPIKSGVSSDVTMVTAISASAADEVSDAIAVAASAVWSVTEFSIGVIISESLSLVVFADLSSNISGGSSGGTARHLSRFSVAAVVSTYSSGLSSTRSSEHSLKYQDGKLV